MSLSSSYARELMGEAMDARALNHQQAQWLVNDTPEIDCILDHLAQLVAAGHVKPSTAAPLARLTLKLLESNEAEGGHEMELAGAMDKVASVIYDAERNHSAAGLTNREIGRELRWALPIIFEPEGHSPAARAGAGAAVARVLDQVPEGQLFTESIRKELRNINYVRLTELYAARQHEQEEGAAA